MTTDAPNPPHGPGSPSTHSVLAIGLGWALLFAFVVATAWLGRHTEHARAFQLAYLVGFAGYFLILAVLLRRPRGAPSRWRAWLVGSLLLRVVPLGVEPTDDAFRYVWEGRLQLAGFNPFAHAPTDPRLASLRDEDWSRINHADYPAIYPPLAQMQFAAIAALAPSVFAMKAAHVLWDGLVILVLAAVLWRRGRPPEFAMVYGLCPLVLTAFGVEGHIDSLMLLLVGLALLAEDSGRPMGAGAALGLAISAKLTAVVLWPWMLFRHPKAAVAGAVVVAATYVPYLSAGGGLFDSLARFGGQRAFFDVLGTLGVPGCGTMAGRAVRALAAGGLMLWFATRRRDLAGHGLAAMGALVLLMPVVHPWYLTWVLIFVPFAMQRLGARLDPGQGDAAGACPGVVERCCSSPAAWLLAAVAMVCYGEANAVRVATGEWVMPSWAPLFVWSAFLAGVLGEQAALTWARRSSRRRESPS